MSMKRPKGNDIFTYLLPLSSFFMPAQIKFTQTQRSSTRTRPKTRLLLFEGIANPTRDNVCVPKLCQSYTVIHYTKKVNLLRKWSRRLSNIKFNRAWQIFAIWMAECYFIVESSSSESRHRPNSDFMGRFGFPWVPLKLNQKVRERSPN